MHGTGQSFAFLNIYECKLPHEMTGQWRIPTKDYENWVEIDVDMSTAWIDVEVLPRPITRVG